MTKQIYFNTEAREALKRGIDALANAVKVTLGPQGRNVIIDKKYATPQITKDGVTVAKEIILKPHIESMGAQLIKEVALKTSDVAGDGTTTATVLAQSIITTGLKNLTAGANPMDLKRGIDKAVNVVKKELKLQSKEVGDTFEKIKQVATISANNDPVIGQFIAEAMEKVKKEGIITIEEAKGTETSIKVVDGLQFDKGFISPYFITDTDKMEAIYESPYILIYDSKISNMKEILPIFEKIYKESARPLLIIAEDVDGEALATMVINKIKGVLKVVAVKAPEIGDRRQEILEDIATITGGMVVSKIKGMKLEETTLEHLGKADKVIVDEENTTIVGGNGNKEDIQAKIEWIKKEVEIEDSDFYKDKLQKRYARLAGGIAVIYVGAISEVEMKEKKDRFDDALHATFAAVEEGIVPGGGVAYIRCIPELDKLKGENDDENIGIAIVKRALEEPLRQIVENAGIEGSVVVNKVKEGINDYGFNARTEVYEKLYDSGIIDPTKVTRVAIENAASVAGMFLTTECVLVNDWEEEEKQERNHRIRHSDMDDM